MRKIIELETPKEHYQGAPCIVWCFDDRFHGALQKFREFLQREFDIQHVDIVKVAGGARDLASKDEDYKMKTALWEQIEASLELHQAPWVGLMAHADCSAYGKKFANEKEEASFYEAELVKARDRVKEFFKGKRIDIPVKLYYADFTGLYEISRLMTS